MDIGARCQPTPTRRAVAVIEARLGRKITGRLIDISPPDLRQAVKLLARQLAKENA